MGELILSADFKIDGYTQRLELLGDKALNIGEPLARVGGFIKGQAKHRIDAGGPGWPPLAPATVARKLTGEQFAFFARFGKRKHSIADTVVATEKKISRLLIRSRDGKTEKQRAKALASAEAHGEFLAQVASDYGSALKIQDVDDLLDVAHREMQRRKMHGYALAAARMMELRPGEHRVERKYVDRKGRERTASVVVNPSKERRRVARIGATRYRRDIRSTQVLGSLRDALHLYVDGGHAVVVFAGPKWSGVHNRGGTAGHGAKIPKREYLTIDSDSIVVAVGIFREHLLEPFLSDAEM